MKKITLLLFAFILAKSGFAQRGIPVSVEEFKEGKYLVKIIVNTDNTFGYDIYKKNRLIVHQKNNVSQNIPTGFKNRENAIKFARFHLNIIDAKKDPGELLKIENIKKLNLISEELPNPKN